MIEKFLVLSVLEPIVLRKDKALTYYENNYDYLAQLYIKKIE